MSSSSTTTAGSSTAAPDDKCVLHYLGEYLKVTMTWVYNQIQYNNEYRHQVVTQSTENLDIFPTENIYSLDSLSSARQIYNKVAYRLRGYYPDFASQNKPSLIQAHFGHYGYKALGLKRKMNVPLATFFYGYEMSSLAKNAKYQRRYHELFREGELFLVIGNAMKKSVMGMGCPENKITIFHLGVDVEHYPFRERTWHEGENITLLFAANFGEKKGLPYAIRAFAKAHKRHKHLRFRIIGDGPNRKEIESLIAELGVGDAVELKGFVPYSTLVDEMMRADLFIQPSVTASNGNTEGGYPVAVLDAQATGMPILTTRHADNPECVLKDKSAKISEERDWETLGQQLIDLVEAPQTWPAMGHAGRAHVDQQYNARTQGRVLAKIYDRLIDSL